MTLSREVAESPDQIFESLTLPGPIEQFHLEPRCRVCRTEPLRTKVNEMLAAGAGYAYIVRSLAEDNARLDPCDRVTLDSVRNHTARHFPVQQVARATYRDILERRARENQVDFVEGVATALTPLAFIEVVMNKAFRTLVDDKTEVSVDTGLRAAEKLQALMNSRDYSAEIAETRLQLSRIIDAVRSTVPQDLWGTILRKLGLPEEQPVLDDAGYFDDDDEPFDPTESSDDDDEF